MPVYESHFEEAALNWFAELGYQRVSGYEIAPAPDGVRPERANYKQVILLDRLRTKLRELNPAIPPAALADAVQQILNPNQPTVMQANRQFHRWLRDGVKVEYQSDERGDGATVGDFVQLVDFAQPDNNDWAAINQFTVKGPHHTKRPDIIVFLNGLPLAVLELKNPADEKADIWTAYNQLQTYKEQIPDLFITNELLVISDSVTARFGSLTADKERFMEWRTIDGATLDPLGQFRKAETLIRGLFRREELRRLLAARPSGGVIFTTIQKFSPYEKEASQKFRQVLPSNVLAIRMVSMQS